MNRILVLHDSKSGNTAQMASFIAEGAQARPTLGGMDRSLLSRAEGRTSQPQEERTDDAGRVKGGKFCLERKSRLA